MIGLRRSVNQESRSVSTSLPPELHTANLGAHFAHQAVQRAQGEKVRRPKGRTDCLSERGRVLLSRRSKVAGFEEGVPFLLERLGFRCQGRHGRVRTRVTVHESVQCGGVGAFELWRSRSKEVRGPGESGGRCEREGSVRHSGLTVSTTCPFLIAKKVGMAWILYFAAMLGHLSTSNRTNETQSTDWASLSNTGAIALQGPHQVCGTIEVQQEEVSNVSTWSCVASARWAEEVNGGRWRAGPAPTRTSGFTVPSAQRLTA